MTTRTRVALCATLAGLVLAAPAAAQAATGPALEAETMSLPSWAGMVRSDSSASGGRSLLIWSDASAKATASLPAGGELVVRARGEQCDGAPRMVVSIDGRKVLDRTVPERAWTDVRVPVDLPAGRHDVAVAFTNDRMTETCDRNLFVDSLDVSPSVSDPFAGATLFVDPDSPARRQVEAWRATRPADAQTLEAIADASQADWFGTWYADLRAAVDGRVTQITAAGALPVLVAYAIPARDCGGYSAGGVNSPDGYRAWIRDFAAGIGDRRAAVVLEPDALAGLGCLASADRDTRLALLAEAVDVFAAKPNVLVYLDAGHANWIAAAEMAGRLDRAGVAGAQGFALNVSNFGRTADQVAYGRDLSARVGAKHFVIDTSRNGLGPAPGGEWCNPAGRALGEQPGATTAPLVDAHLWIKRPGESDGTCNGGPSAGQWWAEYA
ncbi:MAG: glycoside hydrolase family 6 protein, partial [Actinomycetota bacterium]|nr:glycoside hydrolase family 6 protein [Actinomycetota bacterium]